MTPSTNKPKPIKKPVKTHLNDMVRQWKREIDSAPICEPGPDEYVAACHWSRTGWAIWKDGGCSCRPAIAVKPRGQKPDDGFGDYGVKINGSPVISRTGSR